MPQYLVVSGLPASGKTTIATALAEELALPHLDKDNFLEALFDSSSEPQTMARRTALSRKADEDFRRIAERANVAVLSSWWRHPLVQSASGTDSSWLMNPGVSLLEVHCALAPKSALERFFQRRRHPGHMDAQRDSLHLLAQFETISNLGPLFPDRAIVLPTERATSGDTIRALAERFAQLCYPVRT
jgi:glucokinase